MNNIGRVALATIIILTPTIALADILDEFQQDSAEVIDLIDPTPTATIRNGMTGINHDTSIEDMNHGETLFRKIQVSSQADYPATAAIVDPNSGWMTLLTSPEVISGATQTPVAILTYSFDLGGKFNVAAPFTGIRVNYAGTSAHSIAVVLYHAPLSTGNRWTGSTPVAASASDATVLFSTMTASGPSPGATAQSVQPLLVQVIFTLTNPEDAAPVVESIEFI